MARLSSGPRPVIRLHHPLLSLLLFGTGEAIRNEALGKIPVRLRSKDFPAYASQMVSKSSPSADKGSLAFCKYYS